jgi:hypothetical protein
MGRSIDEMPLAANPAPAALAGETQSIFLKTYTPKDVPDRFVVAFDDKLCLDSRLAQVGYEFVDGSMDRHEFSFARSSAGSVNLSRRLLSHSC